MAEDTAPTWLDLYDWRTRVAAIYRERARRTAAGDDPVAVWDAFRVAKDALFVQHPQSPLEPAARADFRELSYFPYDPTQSVIATLVPESAEEEVLAPSSGPHAMPLRRAGRLSFTLAGADISLAVYWIDVYGGGLFLPFRDATSGGDTYGAGRYLHDTVKGSELLRLDDASAPGYAGGRVLLDFNYAYNPSCAYDPRWVCPLTPMENRLTVAIRAGERVFHA
jgi:uncharacterized protein